VQKVSVATAWVKKTYQTKGLDPLGVQAPSINIYGQLLPGITNVTDRARYYSFYPWMIWAYEQQPRAKTQTDLQEWVRRSDCLFTMIGIRHRISSGDDNLAKHEQGLVGRDTLSRVVTELGPGKKLHLSDYTITDDGNENRYFKNPLGGLKQYYIGTFDGLGLMTTKGSAVANTNEGGKALAETMDSAVNRDLFTSVVWSDAVTTESLDALSCFCPCQLPVSSAEHKALIDLFFEHKPVPSPEGIQRRMSLGLMLDLVEAMNRESNSKKLGFDQTAFRGSVYSGALCDGNVWELPSALNVIRTQWRVYQKHEILSVAVQCLFWVALETIARENVNLSTTEEFIHWFEEQVWLKDAAIALGSGTFVSVLDLTRQNLPSLADWLDSEHEIALTMKALETYGSSSKREVRTELLILGGKLLMTLAARDVVNESPYAPLEFPSDYLNLHQINLDSLRNLSHTNWSAMHLNQWLAWVAGHWGIEAHLRVALRKLRYETKDTFHVLPTDRGFSVEAMPEPTYTSPRFVQAVQILSDIGAIQRTPVDSLIALTPLGEELWRECHV
jgi:hypothetical protein